MASLSQALDAMGVAITTAVNAAGITTPSQCFKGWPTGTQMTQIAGQGQFLVSMFPLHAKRSTRYPPVPIAGPSSITAATIIPAITTLGNATTITLNGTVTAGQPIHVVLGVPNADVFYIPTNTDTLATIATNLSVEINALGLSGVSSTHSANALTITGARNVQCTVSATATLLQEIGRLVRQVQVTVWAPNPSIRDSVENAIVQGIGNTTQPFLTAADGSAVYCLLRDDAWSDKAESSYSVFRADLLFDVEYPIIATVPATAIDAVKTIGVLNNNVPVTTYIG